MSELTNLDPVKPVAAGSCEDMKKTCAELESQLHTLRLVVLVAVAISALFFWREGNLNGAAVAQMQPQVTQIMQYMGQLEKQGSSYEKQIQALQAIAMRLSDYGRTHADYQPVLAKYGVPMASAPAPAAAKPAAAPAAQPKK